jgi:transcription antitermination factor NusG
MKYWYTLYTKPHKEHQVEALLAARSVEAYFPTVPTPHRGNKSAQSAFFPCYLFARADLDEIGLWPLHYLPGVRRVVMLGGIPVKVDVKTDIIYANGDVCKPGDRVIITSGPLADLEAVYDQRLSPAGRVRILIDVLNRVKPVELDASMLRKTVEIPRHNLVANALR